MPHTVKKAAELSGVSVRTLHHYDHIGLLCPSESTEAGYRLYSDGDLARLQQVLFFRELGFELKRIKELLDEPGFDRLAALRSHRQLLAGMQGRLGQLLATCDKSIAAMEGGQTMAAQELFDGFDEEAQDRLQAEAKERWGHTEAWRQSQARMKGFTKEDVARLKADMKALWGGYAKVMHGPADGPEALAMAAEQHRFFEARFYDCPLAMYRNLATMYVEDERFHGNFETLSPGLTQFVRDAIHAYCDREEAALAKA